MDERHERFVEDVSDALMDVEGVARDAGVFDVIRAEMGRLWIIVLSGSQETSVGGGALLAGPGDAPPPTDPPGADP